LWQSAELPRAHGARWKTIGGPDERAPPLSIKSLRLSPVPTTRERSFAGTKPFPRRRSIKVSNWIIPEHPRAAHWSGFDAAMTRGVTKLQRRPMLTRALHNSGHRLYVEMAFAICQRRPFFFDKDQGFFELAGYFSGVGGH
jgi:hypothetical protein